MIEIQPITPEILPAVLDIDELCFGGLWTREGYQREIDSPHSDLLGLFLTTKQIQENSDNFPHSPSENICGANQSILLGVGCLWAILEEAHITIIAIHPQFQHQGLGQAMLVALLTCAVSRHLERATLEVRASNQAAIGLYQKYGFRGAGRRRAYYQDTGEDGLIFWLGGLHYPEFAQTLAGWQQQVNAGLAKSSWQVNYQHLACML